MTLKYASTPQLIYSGNSGSAAWRSRFPADAMPISQAPPNQAIFAYQANGQGEWAHYRSGAFRRLAPQKDFKTGAVTWREDGTSLNNPVMFTLPKRG